MIQYREVADSAPPALADLTVCLEPSEQEQMAANLQRLVALIDEKLPAKAVRDNWSRAEVTAGQLISHLVEFEGARYSRRPVNGQLYGLRLGGVSTSSTSSPIVLLRNWQKLAHTRIEQLA